MGRLGGVFSQGSVSFASSRVGVRFGAWLDDLVLLLLLLLVLLLLRFLVVVVVVERTMNSRAG